MGVDLGAAVIITSLLRERLTPCSWRAVHWLAYAAYPLVVAHGIGAGKDLRSGWLLALTVATLLGVVAAVGYRVTGALGAVSRPGRIPEQLARAARAGGWS